MILMMSVRSQKLGNCLRVQNDTKEINREGMIGYSTFPLLLGFSLCMAVYERERLENFKQSKISGKLHCSHHNLAKILHFAILCHLKNQFDLFDKHVLTKLGPGRHSHVEGLLCQQRVLDNVVHATILDRFNGTEMAQTAFHHQLAGGHIGFRVIG